MLTSAWTVILEEAPQPGTTLILKIFSLGCESWILDCSSTDLLLTGVVVTTLMSMWIVILVEV